MEIEEKNGVTYYSNYEIDKALTNLERGISLETFFKYEAKRFEFGENDYFNMLIREVEIRSEMYDNRQWEYYELAFSVGLAEVEKIIIDLQKTFEQAPAKQLETNLTPEQRRKAIDEPKIYKHNPKNENYLHDYLNEIRTSFDFNKKNTFGAVCLALLENKIFNPTVKYNKLVKKLAEYWNIEPLKDEHPSHYRKELKKLIMKYEILERKKI